MLFNSLTFVLFFGLVVGLYYAQSSWASRKATLLIASYLFYSAWNPPFVALLWISTIVDWFVAKGIAKSDRQSVRWSLLLVSLAVNLGLLAFFKYAGFALETFVTLVQSLGVQYSPAAPDIILPMGISFYTFQTLSYSLDVYRKRDKPASSFLDYALYVTFFPQLVAGPIVRSHEFLPQCQQAKRWSGDLVGHGVALMTIGLFQKVVLADALLAPVVEQVYDRAVAPGFVASWVGTLAFAGQIFFDFAGYSICAIGAALCLGFELPRNFRAPYAAVGFSDFWQRWHITLSAWLRDYLYIPLGGNRKGTSRTLSNLMVTMLIGGLWHGAAWTFVIWGALHGLYLIAERGLKAVCQNFVDWTRLVPRVAVSLLTFIAVCFSWVFFRASSLSQALDLIAAMTTPNLGLGIGIDSKSIAVTLGIVGGLLLLHQLTRTFNPFDALDRIPSWLLSTQLGAMLYLIVTMPSEDRAFIYFQF